MIAFLSLSPKKIFRTKERPLRDRVQTECRLSVGLKK